MVNRCLQRILWIDSNLAPLCSWMAEPGLNCSDEESTSGMKGATAGGGLQAWSATANMEAPEAVREVHGDYLRAGADIVISNNFWTSPTRMATNWTGDRWEAYARAAAENAIAARDAVNPEAYVAGGIAPPCVQRQSEGRQSDVDIMGEEAYRREIGDHAKLLAEVGVDVIWVEYVGYIADCVAAADACAGTGLPVFLGVSAYSGRRRHAIWRTSRGPR